MTVPEEVLIQRLQTALELHEAGVDLMRNNLRRRNPTDTEEEIQKKLTTWLHTRPGAENGDCPGRPYTLRHTK